MPEGRILVSKYNNTPVVTAFCDSDLEFLSFARNTGLQNIYVGKVDHVVKNIDSAFIRIKDDNISYLSTKKINPVCVLNRDFSKNPELKSGDELIVQVDTEALKTKKARLSTSLKISGKHVVLTLGKSGVGVSLKISDDKRNSLLATGKEVFDRLKKNMPSSDLSYDFGLIIRTNAADLSEDNVTQYLQEDITKVWNRLDEIIKTAPNRMPGSLLYSPSENDNECFYKSDEYDEETNKLINEHISKALSLLKTKNIIDPPVATDSGIWGINEKINDLTRNKVWLKSGAFLIIEQLESFNAIDVNSGKAIAGKNNIIKKVNFEAAEEIMRQIRLRNLSGMILIDFINMKDKSDYDDLTDLIKRKCRQDTVHTRFIDVTALGIIELTRNKNDKSLKEVLLDIKE